MKIIVFCLITLCASNQIIAQIQSSPDNNVSAIFGSSSEIPMAEDNSTTWTATNAYWASPLIYRSKRSPNDGSGSFPFNQYGELMIQGTSHGSYYNKGITFLTWDGSTSPAMMRLRIKENGYIGIGTTNPQAKFEILQDTEASDNALVIREIGNSQKIQMHLAKNGSTEYGYLNLGGNTHIRGNGQLSSFDGRVAIGTTSTGSHKLAVEGSIGAREIKVEAFPNWSDFVFDKDYELPTLVQVEEHIKENGHLKDIPSAEEVKEDGIYLGQMDAKLLQKIEELTLYLIEQNKENQEQRKLIEELQKEVAALKKRS